MAPSKKREREQTAATAAAVTVSPMATAANNNGCSNAGGGAVSAPSATIPTAATAESLKINGHQQEHELFLQAFEKPTQIYRYLRNRHETNPIFLNRTLSYIKDRMSRNNKKRASFKVDSILNAVRQKSEVVIQNYLHIIYDSLYDTKVNDIKDASWPTSEAVCVESILYKITRSKRKDSTLDFQEILCKNTRIAYNPKERVSEHAAISIPVQSMRPMGDQHTLYKLLFRIQALPVYNADNDENEETPKKRTKSLDKIYGCELILYEKSSGFLSEGEYEAMLQPLNSTTIKSFSPKKCTWETMPDNYIPPVALSYDPTYNQRPTLKFHLALSNEELPALLSAPELHKYAPHVNVTSKSEPSHAEEINHNNNCIKHETVVVNSANGGDCTSVAKKSEHIQLVYNFMYSNNTLQQTEYTRELNCPWCGLNCLRLYGLLKHLKLCHARFNFTYTPVGNCARIDVTINDTYDGSYAGSPYDLAGPSGTSFARTCGPVRRTSVTSLLVCRPRRQKTCLDEFFELEEDEISNNRSYVTGHNRLYHHTETCLPVHPKELDIDSEGESDPLWLRQKTIQMIDEFSDVNEGEKELMKLWNLHVMKHGFVGDCQLPLACEMFLEAKGHEIIRKNLYRNFILHMCSLFDYGLISPETVYKTVQKLQGMLSRYAAGQDMMSKQREIQLRFWLEVGIHKQDEQKLRSPQKQPHAKESANSKDIMSNSSTSGNLVTSSTANKKSSMQPPKRMPSSAKRAGTLISHDAADKLANLNGSNSKNVARKSAADNLPVRERRSESGVKRCASNASEKSTAETTKAAIKRRLLNRDSTQPATKRQRTDNNNSTASSLNNNNTRSSSNSAMRGSATTTTATTATLPNTGKRLITRRKSATETLNRNGDKAGPKPIKTGLRTRLSVPLTKVDRR